jgi:hypothetical protein
MRITFQRPILATHQIRSPIFKRAFKKEGGSYADPSNQEFGDNL